MNPWIPAAIVASSACVCNSNSQCDPDQIQKLLPADGQSGDIFGHAVSIFENTTAIGALDDDNGGGAGAVYVARLISKQYDIFQKIYANDGAALDAFGFALDLTQDCLIVGAFRDDDLGENSGSAYMFESTESGDFVQVAKLTASDGEEGDEFGIDVAMSGNIAVVGAWMAEPPGRFDWGRAYIFERDTEGNWNEVRILAPPGQGSLHFGESVAAFGNEVFIMNRGTSSIFVYRRDDQGVWTQAQEFAAADTVIGDAFGLDMDIDVNGTTMIIGAPGADPSGVVQAGAAYIFQKDANDVWIEIDKLIPNDPERFAAFGTSVAINGDVAIVGAHGDDFRGTNSGAVYRFIHLGNGEWLRTNKFDGIDSAQGDSFGIAVELTGNTALIGAESDDDNGPASGSLYVFDLNCPIGTSATLTDFRFARGTHLSGSLPALLESDDFLLRGRSAFGFLSSEPNLLDLRIGAATTVDPADAETLHITIESRCNNPNCIVTWRLVNYKNTNALDEIHAYAIIGTSLFREFASVDDNVDNYIRASDGRIELSIKKVVIATFSVTGFRADFDEVRITVE